MDVTGGQLRYGARSIVINASDVIQCAIMSRHSGLVVLPPVGARRRPAVADWAPDASSEEITQIISGYLTHHGHLQSRLLSYPQSQFSVVSFAPRTSVTTMTLTPKQKHQISQLTGAAKKAAQKRYNQQQAQQQMSFVGATRAQPRASGRGRRLNDALPARRGMNVAAARFTANVKGIGRNKLSSSELFQGGALSNAQLAPRGHGYYDAFAMKADNAIMASAVGPVTPISGHARLPIPGAAGYIGPSPQLPDGSGPAVYAPFSLSGPGISLTKPMPETNSRLFVFNCGSSDDEVGYLMYPNLSGLVTVEPMKVSAFTDLAHPSAPTDKSAEQLGGDVTVFSSLAQGVESIPLRGSLRIVNTTEERFQGGMVRTLRYNGGLLFGHDGDPHDSSNPLALGNSGKVRLFPTVDSYFKLRDMIRDSARTHHYSGRELSTAMQFNLHPADFIRSHTFSQDQTLYEAMLMPRFNTLLVLIDDFVASGTTSNNSYEVNVQVQRAGRFSPGSLHHNNAKDTHADGPLLSRLTELESKVVSMGKKAT